MLLYRTFATLAAPVVAAILVLRLLRGAERAGDLAERLGGGSGVRGAIWVHGASNGELTAARRLIADLERAHPDRPLVITANTLTGRALAARWQLPRATARLAPLDLRWAVARFLDHWQPSALVVLENEVWPNRLDLCRRRHIPVAVIAARMSEASFRRWRRAPRLAAHLLGAVTYLSPQDRASGEHFCALGLPAGRLGPAGTLKAGVALDPPDAAELERLRRTFRRDETLFAASTHSGEDAIVLEAFARARSSLPRLKLIVAPRHPKRSEDIAAQIRAAGFSLAVRSEGEPPSADTNIYLADTMGEMALWYSLAGICFVGGSLVDAGGHTPFEPARFGAAIAHGPHVENFAEPYARLGAAEAAVQVDDADALARAIARLSRDDARKDFAERATNALAAEHGEDATAAAIAAVSALIEGSGR